MKAIKLVTTLLNVVLTAPIWFYLLYKILEAIEASELVWFLFWVYIPVAFFSRLFSEIILRYGSESEPK